MATFRNRPLRERILSGENGDAARSALAAERRRLAKARAEARRSGETPKMLRKSLVAQMAGGLLEAGDESAIGNEVTTRSGHSDHAKRVTNAVQAERPTNVGQGQFGGDRLAIETSKTRSQGDRMALVDVERNAVVANGLPPATATPKSRPKPVINMEKDRIANILADQPAIFEVRDNPKADGSHRPLIDSPREGNRAVLKHNENIQKLAKKHGVDPDLVRAIIWAENARGFRFGSDQFADMLGVSETVLPANINKKLWAPLIGKRPDELAEPENNIEAAVVLIKRLTERITDPTPAKIGSVWQFTGRELVNDHGAAVQRAFDEKPWRTK